MLHKEFLDALKRDYVRHEVSSVRDYGAGLLRSLRRAHRLAINEDISHRISRKGQPEILDWTSLSEDAREADQSAPVMPPIVVEKLANMKLPGGRLWVEDIDIHFNPEWDSSAVPGLLLEEVDNGISFTYLAEDMGYYHLPDATAIFLKNGEIDYKVTATGVQEARLMCEMNGTVSAAEDTAYFQGESTRSNIWNTRSMLAAAWMVSEKNPTLSEYVLPPVDKGSVSADVPARIRAIHPNRLFTEFPGIQDSDTLGAIDVNSLRKSGNVANAIMQAIHGQMNSLSTSYVAWAASLPVEKRPENPLFVTQGLEKMVNVHSGFKRQGSHVFHLNGDLSRVLGQTSLDGLMCDDIKLPYDTFYLSFEEQIAFTANNEALVFEGSYLNFSKSENSLSFTMILSPAHPEGHPISDFRHPITFQISLEPGTSLEQALLDALDSDDYDVSEPPPVTVSEEAIAEAAEFGVNLKAVDKSSSAMISEMHESAFNSVAECLRVIGNSLVLLTERPEQVIQKDEWIGASKEALYQLEAPSKKGRDRGLKMALEEGSLPIRMLSLDPGLEEEIKQTRNDVSEAGRRGSPSVAYWRMGFWRRQPHGPGNSLRRWKWIEPKLCNDKAPLMAAGSHYENKSGASEGPT